jgi:hypothetical protein
LAALALRAAWRRPDQDLTEEKMSAENSPRVSRRQWLQWTAQRDAALTLGGLLQARLAAEDGAQPAGPSAIRACIFIFYYGGPSHLETWDLKPDAPANIRGEFQSIATSVPGLRISEHLPNVSRIMHKAALIRSMHHTNRLHDSASIETLTGRQGPNGDREEFAAIAQHFPSLGGVMSHLWRDAGLDVIHAALPFVFHNVIDVPCQGGGFLGTAYNPFLVQVDPEQQLYGAAQLALHRELPLARIDARRRLLRRLQADAESVSTTFPDASRMGRLYERAFQLLSSESVRQALDIESEDRKTRERYGIYEPVDIQGGTAAANAHARHMRGQNLLVARRLVEAGVPFVNVYDFKQQGQNWDSHADHFGQNKNYLLPAADRGLAALIEDLDERGLLESTLVVATGEFGRTPQINANAGRDHWPDCYSLLLAGGGVTGGAIYGASDRLGAYPALDPVTPADLAATIFWRFGLSPTTEIHDPTGRPYRIADGLPIRALFSAS